MFDVGTLKIVIERDLHFPNDGPHRTNPPVTPHSHARFRREKLASQAQRRADIALNTFSSTCPRGQFLTGHVCTQICLPLLK